MMQLHPIRGEQAGRSGAEIIDFRRAMAMKRSLGEAAAALAGVRVGDGSTAALMRALVAPYNLPHG